MVKNYYRNIMKNIRLIVKCGICGHKQRLEFHHIKSTKLNGEGRGSSLRAYDIIKHPDCYIPLCYFCHQKVTSGEYVIEKGEHALLFYGYPPEINIMRLIHVI
jgi:hypothetical protein